MKQKLLLLVSLAITSVSFAQTTFTYNNINYTITDATNFYVEVSNNPSASGNIIIPETVNDGAQNYTVTSIGNDAFVNSSLTSITIPNSVTTIGNSAFWGCTGLTSITIPNSVTSIGNGAFSDCYGLTSATIGDAVTTIGDGAFANCTSLNSITIPNSVTAIGNTAFYSCSALTTVTIGSGVTSIGDYAFYGCYGLTTVNCYIPTPLTIDPNVFGSLNQSACTLNVPTGTETAYQNAAVWQDFAPINGTLLSANSFALDTAITVYPNPTSEFITVDLKNDFELKNIHFYNTLGQLVKTSTTKTTTISDLAKGNYFVEVVTNEGTTTKQIVVN